MFADAGPPEDEARRPDKLPAAVETEPGNYKPLEQCSRPEVEAKIVSLMIQAQALLEEAKTLQRYLGDDQLY